MEYVLRIVRWPRFTVDAIVRPLVLVLRHLHDHFIPHHRNNYHPHILGHRSLALFSALLVAVKIFTISLVSFGPVLPVFSSAITSENIISLTNESRKSFNLPALVSNQLLAKAAQAKANDMLAKGYFAHNSPDGKTPWDFIVSAGYSYLSAGENLAVNFVEAESVEAAWMNSPGHKANILNKSFEEIGIGISQGEYQGHPAIFVVQMFGVPVEQPVKLLAKPTEVQTQSVPAAAAPEPVKPVAIKTQSPPPLKPIALQPKPVQTPTPKTQNLEQPSLLPVLTEPLAIKEAKGVAIGEEVSIQAKLSETAVKVLAIYGKAAVMLEPKAGGLWQGSTSLAKLVRSKSSVTVKAFDINGQTVEESLGTFFGSTIISFNPAGEVASANKVSFLGRVFDPKLLEQKFYLLFMSMMLASLVLAIGLKRHIQHLSLITNSSFVIILATLLWFGG